MLFSKRNHKLLNARMQRAQSLNSRLVQQKSVRRGPKDKQGPGIIKLFWLKALDPAIKLVFIAATATLLLLGGYVGLAHSSLFELRKVTISGSAHLSRLDILSAGKLGTHTNLISLKPALVEDSIRENLPWISHVKIERQMPNSINIIVVEQVPFAIGLIDEKWFYLNSDLKPFAPFTFNDELNLPVITGLSRKELLDEDTDMEEMLVQARVLLEGMPQELLDITGQISQIDINKAKGLQFVFANVPATLKIGFNFNEVKQRALKQVLYDLAQRNELYKALLIDLSQEKMTIVRLGQEKT